MDKTRERVLERVRKKRSLPPPEQREAIRVAAGLSIRDLADTMEVAPATAHYWETGQRNPNSKHLDRYLSALQAMSDAVAAEPTCPH